MKLYSYILVLLGCCGCLWSNQESIVLDQWAFNSKPSLRKIAVANQEKKECFKDQFTIDGLKNEIEFYENQESKLDKIKGKFKHLDFKDIPRGQARFLKKIKDKLGDRSQPDAINYEHCSNAMCIVNSVYNFADKQDVTLDRVEGYAVYLWFLKMGNVLNLSNQTYGQRSPVPGTYSCKYKVVDDAPTSELENCKSYELKNYLFDKNELLGFWKITHSVSALYKSIVDLEEVQRIPKTAYFEGHNAFTCGLAYSNGYIQLTDYCLSLASDNESGALYASFLHELTHQVDYQWSRQVDFETMEFIGDRRTEYISFTDSELWWKHSGWGVVEEKKSNGVISKVLKSSLMDNQFISAYARTTPTEHFAETMAYYRTDGERSLKTIPTNTFDYAKEAVYSNADFSHKGLIQEYTQNAKKQFATEFMQMASSCLKSETIGEEIDLSAFPELTLTSGGKACLLKKLTEFNLMAMEDLKINAPDACRMLGIRDGFYGDTGGFKKKLIESLQQESLKEVVKHLQLSNEIPGYFSLVEKFFQDLENPSLSMKMYFKCSNSPKAEDCFESEVDQYISSLFLNSDIDLDEFQSHLKKSFKEKNSFQSVRDNTSKAFKDFVMLNSPSVDEVAQRSWKACYPSTPYDLDPPENGVLSFGEGYLVSSFFNCLNREYNLRIEEIFLKLKFNGEPLKQGAEKELAMPYIRGFYEQEIKRLYELERSKEKIKIQEYLDSNQDSNSIQAELITSIQEGKATQLLKMCKDKFIEKLKMDLYFHLSNEVFGDFTQEKCGEIVNSEEIQKTFESTSTSFLQTLFIPMTNKKVEELALLKADSCIQNYPSTNSIQRIAAKKNREKCLRDGWGEIVEEAVNSTISEYSVYKISKEELKGKVELKTKIQQDKIIFKKFN